MINIVEGQAQIIYTEGFSSWNTICEELETIHSIELYTSINVYGAIWIIENIADVLVVTDILKTWSDYAI